MQSDPLKPGEFDAHIKNGTCRISFIGMSNGGKSYRSKVLRDEQDFLWYHVDEQIRNALRLRDISDISSWMGYPDSPLYRQREQQYLALENKFTKEASMQTKGMNFVFDTTGSVAQLNQDTLSVLSDNTLIVHLDVGEDSLTRLIDKFFRQPKPIAWGNYFAIGPNESVEEALRRSYPNLLRDRLRKYRELAHVNVPASEMYDKSGEETLATIRRHLGN